jgi:TonB-linked SusC/RagA family outer membrane protein
MAQGGFELTSSKNEGYWVGVAGVTIQGFETLGAGTRVIKPYSDGDNSWGLSSFFGRVFYTYDERYSLTATARRDESSRFGPDRRVGYFPSASVGWNVSKENFFPASRMIKDLKVRASYGVTGNDQIPAFGWRAAGTLLPTNYIGFDGAVPTTIKNEGYSWESSAILDIGLDVRIADRFNFVFDYYDRQTSDILLDVPLPRTTGFSSSRRNVGRLKNTGLEFALTGDVVRKSKFNWISSFNISFNEVRSVDVNFNAGIFGFSHIARPGQPISIQLYQLEKTVDPTKGNRRIRDLNENGERDDGDMRVVGSPFPKHTGGFTNNLSYKNFELSIFFQWSYGNKIINNTRGSIQNVGKSNISRIGTNLSTEALGRWTKPGDVAAFPGIDYNNNGDVVEGLPAVGVPTDQNLEDGSYLRLKNVNFSYSLPASWVRKHKLTSARFYLTLNNLLTFTKYSGYDPEVSHSGNQTNIGVGIDDGTYPQFRSFVAGINIGL